MTIVQNGLEKVPDLLTNEALREFFFKDEDAANVWRGLKIGKRKPKRKIYERR